MFTSGASPLAAWWHTSPADGGHLTGSGPASQARRYRHARLPSAGPAPARGCANRARTRTLPLVSANASATVLSVLGLRKTYGPLAAVDAVSLAVAAGEVVGLLGPNGAGKTTTLECIEGLRRPDGGEVRIASDGARRSD